jgi:serine/threonine protein phosphatase PrpC
MSLQIEHTGFTLAKGTQLVGDDFFEVKTFEDISIAVLCDGVGSARYGQEAAKRIVGYLIEAIGNRPRSWSIEKSIHTFIHNINQILYRESIESYGKEEMLSTLVLSVIQGDRMYGANVGDSRLYLFRDGILTQLSHDHSMPDEHSSHILQKAMGMEESVDPWYFENRLERGDMILLCSDGLYDTIEQAQIKERIPTGASSLVKFASKQHKENLPDDTTAVVLKIQDIDPRCKLKQAKLELLRDYKAGQTIDGYRLIKPLIQNRRTWLCENRGVNYVIKFAPYEILEDETMLDLFVQEASNAVRLKAGFFPRSVIPRNRTHRYYILRHYRGDTLARRVSKKHINVDEVLSLGLFLLRASQFLIRRGKVHGDIKPENIMLIQRRGKTVFKLLDFGSIVDVYGISSRAGTPSYLAPERFANAPISERSEIYAIGTVLYQALTGTLPYGDIEPFQTPKFDSSPRIPSKLNPQIPQWLDHVIMRSLSADPQKRYSRYSEFVYELQHPESVKAFFRSSASVIERKPLAVCRILLGIMTMAVILLLTR